MLAILTWSQNHLKSYLSRVAPDPIHFVACREGSRVSRQIPWILSRGAGESVFQQVRF
uniref:Uncharacterized protein n=1 Tax=Helianthus annuus TaxID=4232 RepID=A0A251TM67_HELAN